MTLRGGAEPPTQEELDKSVKEHEAVLMEALAIYRERNAKYGDAWRRSGWRGTLTDLRRKIERAWSFLWNAEPGERVEVTAFQDKDPSYVAGEGMPDFDDVFDIINYAAFTIRAGREGNRDGYGGWW
jgi:hypothetical protein